MIQKESSSSSKKKAAVLQESERHLFDKKFRSHVTEILYSKKVSGSF